MRCEAAYEGAFHSLNNASSNSRNMTCHWPKTSFMLVNCTITFSCPKIAMHQQWAHLIISQTCPWAYRLTKVYLLLIQYGCVKMTTAEIRNDTFCTGHRTEPMNSVSLFLSNKGRVSLRDSERDEKRRWKMDYRLQWFCKLLITQDFFLSAGPKSTDPWPTRPVTH